MCNIFHYWYQSCWNFYQYLVIYIFGLQITMSTLHELGSEYLRPVSGSYSLLYALKLNNNFSEGQRTYADYTVSVVTYLTAFSITHQQMQQLSSK
jgi:hypothetical protein